MHFTLRRSPAFWLVLSLAGLMPRPAAFGQSPIAISWAPGGADNDFANGANWAGGVAPADDLTSSVAHFFSATPSNPVDIFTTRSVAGIQFDASSEDFTLVFRTGGTLVVGAAGIVNASTTATQTISTPLKLGTDVTSTNAGTLAIATTLDTNGHTLTVDGAGTTAITAIVSGSGGLTKTGTGLFTFANLYGPNTYTGPTIVSAGTLQLETGSTLPSTNAVTVASDATLDLHAIPLSSDRSPGRATS